ncbi:MAG: hypothetical protein IT364_17610 [Candidatus Hydrogenedentes bacterium]|nr:hypothetical protein [Candidatus Hydrogenedentota bacterium]
MKFLGRIALCAAFVLGPVVPAMAWGPKANVAIVSTSARLISKESGVPLANLEKDIRSGAEASSGEIEALIPGAGANPVNAIESEMYLLQAVRGSRVDPYYAYRLGVLGALVAQVTGPLYDSNPTYRNRYYDDVEANIDRVEFQNAKRIVVDPPSYFGDVIQAAGKRQDLILSDYRSGAGFKGVAGTALSEDASRSVNAVADVMLTVLRGSVTVTNISQGQIRDYILSAVQFFLARGNDAETESAYKKLVDLGFANEDLQKQIGDMYFDAGKYERAMELYRAVLAKSPSRRDVIERIAEYYVRVGDGALAEKKLEAALEAYTNALNADLLHPTAQSKKLEVEGMIAERDSRQVAAQKAIGEGDDLLRQAEQLVFKREFTDALNLLRQAQECYGSVTDEFPNEARQARGGQLDATNRIAQLQKDVVSNASSLSGLGSGGAVREEAAAAAQQVDEEALKRLLQAQFEAELERLKTESIKE